MPSSQRIVVTGATGHLGRAVVEHLLDRGVAPGAIVAGGRNLDAAKPLADSGVDVRRIDYDDPASVTAAVEGATRVLVVSGLPYRIHYRVDDATDTVEIITVAHTSQKPPRFA